MKNLFRPALSLFILLSIITGLIYPLVVTILGGIFFPDPAQGSLITRNNQTVGSILIGQNFTDPKYFWGRPSATASAPYNGMASGGSNLGPLNPALIDSVKERIALLENNQRPIPVDLVTASASGLDPHISPAAAYYQINRIASRRGISDVQLKDLINAHIETSSLDIFGEYRVNVLMLNLALDNLLIAK